MRFKTSSVVESLRRLAVALSFGLGIAYIIGMAFSVAQFVYFIAENGSPSLIPALFAIHITPAAHLAQLFALAAFAHLLARAPEKNAEKNSLILLAIFLVTGIVAFLGNIFTATMIFRAASVNIPLLFRSIDVQSIILAGTCVITYISIRQSNEMREENAEFI